MFGHSRTRKDGFLRLTPTHRAKTMPPNFNYDLPFPYCTKTGENDPIASLPSLLALEVLEFLGLPDILKLKAVSRGYGLVCDAFLGTINGFDARTFACKNTRAGFRSWLRSKSEEPTYELQ